MITDGEDVGWPNALKRSPPDLGYRGLDGENWLRCEWPPRRRAALLLVPRGPMGLNYHPHVPQRERGTVWGLSQAQRRRPRFVPAPPCTSETQAIEPSGAPRSVGWISGAGAAPDP